MDIYIDRVHNIACRYGCYSPNKFMPDITLCTGMLSGAPVLISPESAAAIKEGAKTGKNLK